MPKITLTFTQEGLALLGRALDMMPFGVISPLINDINRQIIEQQSVVQESEVVNG
jgi:hypothetical protein